MVAPHDAHPDFSNTYCALCCHLFDFPGTVSAGAQNGFPRPADGQAGEFRGVVDEIDSSCRKQSS